MNGAMWHATSATMTSNSARSTRTPPWRSASVTTPTGSDTQLRIPGALRGDERRAAGRGEVGLGLAIDNLQLDADLFTDCVQKFGAVNRRPAGFGGVPGC